MKIFLLSDLVVHELKAMQVDEAWLSFEQFRESALLWYARYSPHSNVSETLLQETERIVLRIAQRLLDEGKGVHDGSPLRLLGDFPAANYAHPLSARALSASLAEYCEGVCRIGGGVVSCNGTDGLCTSACSISPGAELTCHPALRRLIDCVARMPDETADET